jgi:transient receptor potential cation channel subfamily M protein 2
VSPTKCPHRLTIPLQYVRVSQDTPSSVIYQLMTQHWGLDVPNLLISVTGGAKNFNMKLRLKSIFRRGLVKVAQTTGECQGLPRPRV